PAFNGVDWNALRDELRPEAERAATPDALRAVISRMLARLGDSHFAVLPQNGISSGADSVDRSGAPGFDVRPFGSSLLVTRVEAGSPAERAGLRAGDRITEIDGTSAASFGASLPDTLEPRVRALETWRAGMMALRGPVGSRMTVRA